MKAMGVFASCMLGAELRVLGHRIAQPAREAELRRGHGGTVTAVQLAAASPSSPAMLQIVTSNAVFRFELAPEAASALAALIGHDMNYTPPRELELRALGDDDQDRKEAALASKVQP